MRRHLPFGVSIPLALPTRRIKSSGGEVVRVVRTGAVATAAAVANDDGSGRLICFPPTELPIAVGDDLRTVGRRAFWFPRGRGRIGAELAVTG